MQVAEMGTGHAADGTMGALKVIDNVTIR